MNGNSLPSQKEELKGYGNLEVVSVVRDIPGLGYLLPSAKLDVSVLLTAGQQLFGISIDLERLWEVVILIRFDLIIIGFLSTRIPIKLSVSHPHLISARSLLGLDRSIITPPSQSNPLPSFTENCHLHTSTSPSHHLHITSIIPHTFFSFIPSNRLFSHKSHSNALPYSTIQRPCRTPLAT